MPLWLPHRWAKRLGRSDVSKVLEQTLTEEKAADKKLTDIAESKVNLKAACTLISRIV